MIFLSLIFTIEKPAAQFKTLAWAPSEAIGYSWRGVLSLLGEVFRRRDAGRSQHSAAWQIKGQLLSEYEQPLVIHGLAWEGSRSLLAPPSHLLLRDKDAPALQPALSQGHSMRCLHEAYQRLKSGSTERVKRKATMEPGFPLLSSEIDPELAEEFLDAKTTMCSAAKDPHLPPSRMPRNFDDLGLEIVASVAIKGFTYSESQPQVNSKDERRAEILLELGK
ncbi:hypothetical protein DUI87_10727 [Hirundo rustica rustica]|uniref:Uncharacterized protein n=1 Tax=Hirundo rustica rustica TaxID=333673 RepID=A0A3M0KJE0_HIRRU|nr:hypothetical protein DUI87_10727 [Hirundo rustica rustica]